MFNQAIAFLIVGPTCLVIAALGRIMLARSITGREKQISWLVIFVLSSWAFVSSYLAWVDFYQPETARSVPPLGLVLLVVMIPMFLALVISPTLRSLLSEQKWLVVMHTWRVEGVVFIALAFYERVPWLWALPAGLGDILIGISAFFLARDRDLKHARRKLLVFNVFGLLDLAVAVALGVMTNPGRTQVFHTVPSGEMLTRFPLALVPSLLVPLAVVLHGSSLWQLIHGSWERRVATFPQ
jgi:hypothetical protein